MSNEVLHQVLTGLIAVGCAPLIKGLLDRIKEEVEPSPKTTRRLAYLLSVVAPSVVYLLLATLQGVYEWPAHLLAVIGAFTGSQIWHGERELPSGAEVRVGRMLEDDNTASSAPTVVFEDGTPVE